MLRARTIRKIVGVLGVFIFLVPMTGFPDAWQDVFIMLLGALVFLAVVYKPMLREFFNILHDLKVHRRKKGSHKNGDKTQQEDDIRVYRVHNSKKD